MPISGRFERPRQSRRTEMNGLVYKETPAKTSPIVLAELLHRILVEEDNPQAASETFNLPQAFDGRFREKVFLYREANILLALMLRAKEAPLLE